MLKVALILIVCGLVVFLAYKFYVYYKARQCYYQNLCDFCTYLQSQIGFLKTDIYNLVEQRKNTYKKEFLKTLECYQKALKSTNFREDMQKTMMTNLLLDPEKAKIIDFFDMLGKTNQMDQLSQISACKAEFESKLSSVSQETQKKGTTSFKLGILLAIAIFVIFI